MAKKYKFGLCLNTIYVVLGFVTTIIALLSGNADVSHYVMLVIDLILYISIGYYTIKGYKKPHGNLLRNLMILFVLAQVLKPLLETKSFTDLCNVACMLSIGLIAFMAGRLNKFEQNCFISVIVLALFVYISHIEVSLVSAEMKALGIFTLLPVYNRVTMWIALTSAYFTRYLEHKEAGLEDK